MRILQTFLYASAIAAVATAITTSAFAQDASVAEPPVESESPAAAVTADGIDAGDWKDLLDKDLTHWEKWIGVPHSSVKGLPEGTYQADKVTNGTPMGLNNDPKNVFSIQEDGEDLLLHITGEIYGGLTTKEEFSNYHLQMKHRWGAKKWEPRLDSLRDSGVLYHCHNGHGSFWKVWKSCIEYQVQEKDYGDLYLLAGPKATARGSKPDGKKYKFDPQADYKQHRRLDASSEPDHPNGQWNSIDIYVVGDKAVHVCNGVVILALKDIKTRDDERLDKGQIQLQSEAAECDYKEIRIRPITEFPKDIAEAANL